MKQSAQKGAGILSVIMLLLLLGISNTFAKEEHKISTLRVCGDPGNMPLSNIKGEGFQNKIAEVLAESLGANLSYFWRPTIERGLTRKTFGAGKCDVMMSVPANMPRILTTQPYYRTTYVIVHRDDKDFNIKSLDDPIMKEASVGVFQRSAAREALRRHGVKQNTVLHAMNWTGDIDEKTQPHQQVELVTNGEIDMAAVWGAHAGYHKVKLNEPLRLVPMNVLDDTVYLQFDMSLGIDRRRGKLAKLLSETLVKEKDKIQKILEEFGVPLVKCDSCLISGNLPEHGPYGDITTPVEPGPGDGDVALTDVDKWLANGADINQELNNAIISDDLPRITYLLDKGADVNSRDPQGYTPLTNALRNKYHRVAKVLIERGADIELTDDNGRPPLLISIVKNDQASVELLLDAGADKTVTNRKGLSALHSAVEFASPELVEFLVKRGLDINNKNAAGYTPLMVAVAKHAEKNTVTILQNGADVNAKNKVGVTALMIAVAGREMPIIKHLLRAGARIDVSTDDGQTALTIAHKNGFADVENILNKGGDS